MELFDVRFKVPFTAMALGPSRSGKTYFVAQLIRNATRLMSRPPSFIVYYYQEWNATLFDALRDDYQVQFIQDVPSLEDVRARSEKPGGLLIIDDFAMEITVDFATMFNVTSHHRQLSIVYLGQNIFNRDRYFREMSINAVYLILFCFIRDKTQIRTLALQFYPRNPKYIMEAYASVMSRGKYGHLLIDMHPETSEKVRVLANIFDREKITVFQPSRR